MIPFSLCYKLLSAFEECTPLSSTYFRLVELSPMERDDTTKAAIASDQVCPNSSFFQRSEKFRQVEMWRKKTL